MFTLERMCIMRIKAGKIKMSPVAGALASGMLVCLPLYASWTTSAMTNDTDCGISTDKVYTHAVDLGDDATALTINGVPFHQGTASGTDAIHGGSYLLSDTPGSFTAYNSSVAAGGMHELLEDFYYNGNPMTLWLNGLQAGSNYVVRFYVSGWENATNDWTVNDSVTNVFRVDRSGGQAPGAILSYEGTAQAGGLLAFRAAPVVAGNTFHIFGFTVEQATTPNSSILITNLFNTGVGANGQSLAVGVADPHYKITGPQLPGTAPQAMVITPNALYASGNEPFSRWIGPADASGQVSAGTYTYTTTFTIDERCSPSTARITGHVFADDSNVSISLNGVRALTQSFDWNNDDMANGSKPDVVQENANYFTIVNGQNAGDGPVSFQTGTNTLVFSVPEPGPVTFHGLRTYGMKGTVSPRPPQGTLISFF